MENLQGQPNRAVAGNEPWGTGAPLLTFAIPTWNRAAKLRECVDRIAAQIATCDESVDIYISDNGSEDATPSMIRDLQSMYRYIGSGRQEKNVGFDRNLFAAMGRARGEYVWIFSDDDILVEGALREVLNILRRCRPSYVALNYSCCDANGNVSKYQPYEPYMVAKDMECASLDEVFGALGWVIGFMSRNIYRRDLMKVSTYESQLPAIEVWPQIYAVAQVISGRKDAYVSSFYSVGCRVVEARYGNEAMLRDLPEVLNYSLRTFHASESTRTRCIDQIRAYFITWRSYIKYRALGPEISPLIYPRWYWMIPTVPKFVVRAGLWVKGKLG